MVAPCTSVFASTRGYLNPASCCTDPPGLTAFLQFSDYMRPAVRLAALMDIDTIYVWTHDSIGLGESRPTINRSSTSRRCARSPAVGGAPGRCQRDSLRLARSGPPQRQRAGRVILTRQGVPVLDTDAGGCPRRVTC